MLDWLMGKLGYVRQDLFDEMTRLCNNARDTLSLKRQEVYKLENELKEKDEALSYLPRRFIRELEMDYNSDPPLWMPPGVCVTVNTADRPIDDMDVPVLTARFHGDFAYQIYLNGIDTTGYASAVVDKMSRSVAKAIEQKLTSDGLWSISEYLKRKDKEIAA